MAKKKSRKSRQSKGIHGSPMKARTSTGMARLMNQLEAHLAGKNTRVVVPTCLKYVLDTNTKKVKRGDNKTNKQYVTLPGSSVFGSNKPNA